MLGNCAEIKFEVRFEMGKSFRPCKVLQTQKSTLDFYQVGKVHIIAEYILEADLKQHILLDL